MAFITDRGIDATMEAILRISSFGDKLADNVADGGAITAGIDPTFFTMIKRYMAADTCKRNYQKIYY